MKVEERGQTLSLHANSHDQTFSKVVEMVEYMNSSIKIVRFPGLMFRDGRIAALAFRSLFEVNLADRIRA